MTSSHVISALSDTLQTYETSSPNSGLYLIFSILFIRLDTATTAVILNNPNIDQERHVIHHILASLMMEMARATTLTGKQFNVNTSTSLLTSNWKETVGMIVGDIDIAAVKYELESEFIMTVNIIFCLYLIHNTYNYSAIKQYACFDAIAKDRMNLSAATLK